MGIEVTPRNPELNFFIDFEHALYILSTVIITPLLVCIYLLVILPLSYIANTNRAFFAKIKWLNRGVFKIAKYLFRPLSVDENCTKEIPRFMIHKYSAPVCYTYQLLLFAVMMATYCSWNAWDIALLGAKTDVKCELETELKFNTTECFNLSLRPIQAITAQLALVATIVIFHIFVLEIFLKLSGGKETWDKVWLKPRKTIDLLRVIGIFGAQFFFVIFLKLVYLFYFSSTGFGRNNDFNIFDRSSWLSLALVIDDITFVMMTPWFLLVKSDSNSSTSAATSTTSKPNQDQGSTDDTVNKLIAMNMLLSDNSTGIFSSTEV